MIQLTRLGLAPIATKETLGNTTAFPREDTAFLTRRLGANRPCPLSGTGQNGYLPEQKGPVKERFNSRQIKVRSNWRIAPPRPPVWLKRSQCPPRLGPFLLARTCSRKRPPPEADLLIFDPSFFAAVTFEHANCPAGEGIEHTHDLRRFVTASRADLDWVWLKAGKDLVFEITVHW